MEKTQLIKTKNQFDESHQIELVVIGGSAGSVEGLFKIIPKLPKDFPYPIVITIHRKNNADSSLENLLNRKSKLIVKEAIEKEKLCPGFIYFAPADYHLLIENDKTFSLDRGFKVFSSRPSIDVTFETATHVYKKKLIGILLSGANQDGAQGLADIKKNKGFTIVQNPKTSSIATMPLAAMAKSKVDFVLSIEEITKFLIGLKIPQNKT